MDGGGSPGRPAWEERRCLRLREPDARRHPSLRPGRGKQRAAARRHHV